jgi:hypothetical protein
MPRAWEAERAIPKDAQTQFGTRGRQNTAPVPKTLSMPIFGAIGEAQEINGTCLSTRETASRCPGSCLDIRGLWATIKVVLSAKSDYEH